MAIYLNIVSEVTRANWEKEDENRKLNGSFAPSAGWMMLIIGITESTSREQTTTTTPEGRQAGRKGGWEEECLLLGRHFIRDRFAASFVSGIVRPQSLCLSTSSSAWEAQTRLWWSRTTWVSSERIVACTWRAAPSTCMCCVPLEWNLTRRVVCRW